jgi:hypothetical protein
MISEVLTVSSENEDAGTTPVLSKAQRKSLEGLLRGHLLAPSERQYAFIEDLAAVFGVIGAAPARNVFSSLSEKEQARQREKAKSVVLPWEQPGYQRPLKPPGRAA